MFYHYRKALEMFSGLSTDVGYKPMMEARLSECERVYILKGTPGCGKSTLLKRLYSHAQSKNDECEIIRCSSDPNSFDGFIDVTRKVAVADGTAPHLLEPAVPYVREITVNLGDAVDSEILKLYHRRISQLNKEKNLGVASAMKLIRAATSVENVMKSISDKFFDHEKCDKFANSFIKNKLSVHRGGVKSIAGETVNKNGFESTHVFEKSSTVIRVNDIYTTGLKIIEALYRNCIRMNLSFYVVTCPWSDSIYTGLYFPHDDLYIKTDRYTPVEAAKNIRSERFIIPAERALVKRKLMALQKLYNWLTDEIAQCFLEAYGYHSELEHIYLQSIDFAITDKITSKLKKEIFE